MRYGPSGHCLRLLSIDHIYREVIPDVFTNTRISSVLDTMKPSKDIFDEYVPCLVKPDIQPNISQPRA